jgi:hypothetical protein
MSKDGSKGKKKKWKEKAIDRGKQIKNLEKELKRIKAGRCKWKKKYQALKTEVRDDGFGGCVCGVSPARHGYSCWVITLVLHLVHYGGMSFRSCVHALGCFYRSMGYGGSVPSHVSVRNWVLKQGYCMIGGSRGGIRAGNWGVILDESITIGRERLLVIVGVNLSTWNFSRPLRLEDVEVLHIERRGEWKGEDIRARLDACCSGMEVTQCSCDGGRNLLNSIHLWEKIQVPDCTHRIANILKKHLKDDADFIQMNAHITKFRREWKLGQNAAWRPPMVRGKSRFLNVFPLIDWLEKIRKRERELPQKVRQECEWIFQRPAFFDGLIAVRHRVEKIFDILKVKGAQKTSVREVENLLIESQSPLEKAIYEDIKAYINELDEKVEKDGNPKICCSDVIETLFGKFKYRLKDSSKITDLALSIPFFCGNSFANDILTRFESVTFRQIKDWNNQFYKN